ncbi:hypothetical protein ABOM_007667 [Aspergillus bombycis]|uniref:Uncharacterized protein n=1 Tax=Aspergillus bombycis TaxID=109264 RepID=A0A1F7ZVE5_9EURO|nr:hypothetical protein ABOM_007667 [Aspergillus bombycis]OGM43387.1 hypothetical protein ABOM_007667 [Aspergillus bombycis]
MAKAQHEISQIISSLMLILWKHTDSLGIPHRPFGHDWTEMETHVSRLLLLRGMIQTGSSIPEDPWNFILSEFGPTNAPLSCLDPGDSCSQSSILLQPSRCAPSRCHVRFQDSPANCVRDGRGSRVIARSVT